MKRCGWILLVAVSVAACGSDSAPPTDPDANSDLPADSYLVTWGPKLIPSGVERVECVTKRLGNDVAANINVIHNVLGNVSHHLIVYKSPDTVEQLDPYPCDSIENLINEENGLPIMITQKAEETLTLPQGVAFAMEANQMIRLELHYINASDEAQEVHILSTFTPIADADFEYAADLFFVGNPDISIAANSTFTLGPSFSLMPYELAGSKIFGITGHEHQWGTNVTVDLADSETGPYTTLYDLPAFNWNEPETVYFDTPPELVEGGGFTYTCTWDNKSNRRVEFGQGANDEMCFFWAYYYPGKGSYTCFHTDRLGGGPIDICCPGHQLCNLIDDLLF